MEHPCTALMPACQALKTQDIENFMGVASHVLRLQLYRLEVDMSGCVSQ